MFGYSNKIWFYNKIEAKALCYETELNTFYANDKGEECYPSKYYPKANVIQQQVLYKTETCNILCNATVPIIIQNAYNIPLVLCHVVFAGLGF